MGSKTDTGVEEKKRSRPVNGTAREGSQGSKEEKGRFAGKDLSRKQALLPPTRAFSPHVTNLRRARAGEISRCCVSGLCGRGDEKEIQRSR
jgi:hypothetical protein